MKEFAMAQNMKWQDTSSWETAGYEWTAFRDVTEPACLIFLLVPASRKTRPEAKAARAKPKAQHPS
jgi:hypothetical protein